MIKMASGNQIMLPKKSQDYKYMYRAPVSQGYRSVQSSKMLL